MPDQIVEDAPIKVDGLADSHTNVNKIRWFEVGDFYEIFVGGNVVLWLSNQAYRMSLDMTVYKRFQLFEMFMTPRQFSLDAL